MEATVSFLFNAKKVYQFKTKNLEIKYFALCLVMFQKNLQSKKWKKSRNKKSCKFFSVDFNLTDTDDIHKYLMKKEWYKVIFGLIKKISIELLTEILYALISNM